MIITAPTKQQIIDDEIVTGFKNIRMLRLSNISLDIAENMLSLERYFAINCLVGQEVFITPTLIFRDERTFVVLRKCCFTGADGKKYTSLSMHNSPLWCQMKYEQCRCNYRFVRQTRNSYLYEHMEKILQGYHPFDKMTLKTLEDEDEVRYTMEKAREYYKNTMITPDILKRCARERDLILRKVSQSILDEGARRVSSAVLEDFLQKIKNYMNDLKWTQDGSEALAKIKYSPVRIYIPKIEYFCRDYNVSLASPEYAEICLRIEQLHRSKIDQFTKIKHSTKHTGTRSRSLVISQRGFKYYFDDVLAEDGLDGLYYLMQQKY